MSGSVADEQVKSLLELRCDEDAGQECIIKGVCFYMGEDAENLVQQYVGMDGDAINKAIEDTTVFAMLFGLMYALNFSYPADLRYTFEVIQKMLGTKHSL